MKWTAFIFVTVVGVTSFAQWGGGSNNNNNNNNSGRQSYGLFDFFDYISSFSKVPSKYDWDEVPSTPPQEPGRKLVVPPSPLMPSQIEQPPVEIPSCLEQGTATLEEIYSGACSSGSETLYDALNFGYEGTGCTGSLASFWVHLKFKSGEVVQKKVRVKPDVALQASTDTAGVLTVMCSHLELDEAGYKTLTVDGKTLSGEIVYRCEGGQWRLKTLGCTDRLAQCEPATQPFVYRAADKETYNTPTVTMPTMVPSGSYSGTVITCASLPSPGADMAWAGDGISIGCSGNTWVATQEIGCLKVAKGQTTYPQCSGPNTLLTDFGKTGFNYCMTADSTKYYWYYIDGYGQTNCATATGCAF